MAWGWDRFAVARAAVEWTRLEREGSLDMQPGYAAWMWGLDCAGMGWGSSNGEDGEDGVEWGQDRVDEDGAAWQGGRVVRLLWLWAPMCVALANARPQEFVVSRHSRFDNSTEYQALIGKHQKEQTLHQAKRVMYDMDTNGDQVLDTIEIETGHDLIVGATHPDHVHDEL